MKTSYSYIKSDSSNLAFNESDKWITEEFYYQDVIECKYNPQDSDVGSVKGTSKEYRIDGFLSLSLVNGTNKKYATTKKDVESFLKLARKNIRETKLS